MQKWAWVLTSAKTVTFIIWDLRTLSMPVDADAEMVLCVNQNEERSHHMSPDGELQRDNAGHAQTQKETSWVPYSLWMMCHH